ncbi:4553_t:CDS:2 [Dentiscutata erythropus]|uniref:4553_t:CDS:1 n=1 Tax=Dentiscutata erythropus TaxID=1348616 RepID=A0A9N9ET86_9GLOM|nr:4553_t:CDS:2 [Dentiscutata erythropus]
MAQYPKASKTFEVEARASDISNIDFDTLLEKESQSETGLTSVLKSATIRSSSSIMSLNDVMKILIQLKQKIIIIFMIL